MTTTPNPTAHRTIPVLEPVAITIAQQGGVTIRSASYVRRTASTALILVAVDDYDLYAPHSAGIDHGRAGYHPALRVGREEGACSDTVVAFDDHKDWQVFAVYSASQREIAVALCEPLA